MILWKALDWLVMFCEVGGVDGFGGGRADVGDIV